MISKYVTLCRIEGVAVCQMFAVSICSSLTDLRCNFYKKTLGAIHTQLTEIIIHSCFVTIQSRNRCEKMYSENVEILGPTLGKKT